MYNQAASLTAADPTPVWTLILVLPLVQASEGAAARRPSLPQVAAQGPAWSGTPGGGGRGDAVSRWPLPVLSGEWIPLLWLPCWASSTAKQAQSCCQSCCVESCARLLLLLCVVNKSSLQRQEEPFASRYPLNVSNQSGVLHWIESMLTHLAPPGIKLDMVQIRQEATRGSSEGACTQCARTSWQSSVAREGRSWVGTVIRHQKHLLATAGAWIALAIPFKLCLPFVPPAVHGAGARGPTATHAAAATAAKASPASPTARASGSIKHKGGRGSKHRQAQGC